MIGRREFITLVGGAAAAWPLPARAQQTTFPVVTVMNGSAADVPKESAFRKGLSETGYVDGQNVNVEFYWLQGQYDRVPALMSDFVRRRVAVIATPGLPPAAVAARAATVTIPIVFGISEAPVRLGLVASLARPGGNATGINFFTAEIGAKRLSFLHELVPQAARIAVLLNPANTPVVADTVKDVEGAARALGLEIKVFNASSSGEIDTAFASFAHERA